MIVKSQDRFISKAEASRTALYKAQQSRENDSKHSTVNLNCNEVSSQQSPHLFQCSHCVLTFKSKLALLDHVSKEHGHILPDSLHDIGLASSGSNAESSHNHSNSDDDFASPSQPQKSQHKQKANNCPSTLKTTSKPILKDLRSYLKQSGKITDYLTPSVSNVTSPALKLKSTKTPTIPNDAKEALFLQECPGSSKQRNNSVLKITATSSNDLRKQGDYNLLLPDRSYNTDHTSSKSDLLLLKEPFLCRIGKRTSDSSESPQAKKYKGDPVQVEITTIKSKVSHSSSFLIDFSDSEEESKVTQTEMDGKAHLDDKDSPKTYHCKHCDYTNVDSHNMVTHYEDVHPYIRCKWRYIQDLKDQSATFRCLDCPVEFSDAQTLKKHYTESHPGTPDIFSKESRDLVFKCFVCPFTAHLCQALKEHYQEKHPKYIQFNSLMYYRYSAKRGKESSRSDSISVKSVPVPNTMERTASPQSPTLKGINVDLYQCENCTFISKSAVAMLVHYVKAHPKAGVTLDQIKQSLLVSSNIEPTVSESSSYTNTGAVKEEEVSHQNTCSMSPKNICVTPEVSPEKGKILDSDIDSNQNKSPKLEDGESSKVSLNSLGIEVEDTNRHDQNTQLGILKRTSVQMQSSEVQCHANMSAVLPKKYDTTSFTKFYCQVCDYTSHTVRGVIGHQSAKHMQHFTIGETLAYTAQMQKQQAQSKGEASKNHSSAPNVQKHLVDGESTTSQHEDKATINTLANISDAYEHPENLFYCLKCNFGHPSIKGVLSHQRCNHPGVKRTAAQVFSYTAVIRGQIKAAKSHRRKSPFNSGLPLPLMDKVDESMLFCFMCNYRHKSLNRVMDHIKEKHPGHEVDSSQITGYSSKIHDQNQKSHQEASSKKAFNPFDKIENKSPISSHHRKSASKETAKVRLLRCHKCPYESPHVYLLRRHLYSIHNSKHTPRDILQMAFDAGIVQAGYHCEWCVYSSKTAKKVHLHCQKQHEYRKISIENIKVRLHVGLKSSTSKKKRIQSQDDLKTSPSQVLKKKKTKTYPCRMCSFKGRSKRSIARHYHNVHPWFVKEDGSVLNLICSKVLSVNSKEEAEDVHQELPATFKSSQMPIDFETEQGNSPATSEPQKCLVCSMLFSTEHGLLVHYGMKHPGFYTESSDVDKELEPAEEQTRIPVYKCKCCTYVNTSPVGVLTHCQMKHPSFKARQEKLQSDEIELPNIEYENKKGLDDPVRFSGYRCKLCPVACESLKQLRRHYEQDHHQSKPNLLNPLPKHSPVNKKCSLSRHHSSQGSILEALFKKQQTAAMKCNFCKFTCKTKLDLTRHLNIYHKNASSEEMDCVYKCALCSYSSPLQNYLAKHYKRKHGKPAFLTYYVPVFKRQTPAFKHQTPATNNIVIYKCQLCAYSSQFKRYLSGHYMRRHGSAAFKKHYAPLYKQKQTKCRDNKYRELLQAPQARCVSCRLQFKSLRSLSAHYTSVHKSDVRKDFTLVKGSLYKCGHCHARIKSVRKLCGHLEHHSKQRGKRDDAVTNKTSVGGEKRPEMSPVHREKTLGVQTPEELGSQSVTPVVLPHPPTSPYKLWKYSQAKDCTCKDCGRTFMSLTGLRNHERSHAAIAALKRSDTLPDSPSKHLPNKYISYHARSVKPFRCEICLHRTTHSWLIKKHIRRKHKAECLDITSSSAETTPHPNRRSQSENSSTLTSELQEDGTYSEPPDIQRQLNHYSLLAQASASAPGNQKELKPPEDKLIHCEFCNFTTEHMSSVRRHYLSLHSRKLLRCKDCWFFTGLRQNLKLHREMGHSNCPSEPTHQKVLRCPLCLYQTKNKNNMIDHVVLHREERVIPIEARRPKLSRYLQGVVFRCHECTFSSASAETLRLHVQKHADVKPYKCRLCYFDCTQLGELEAHLCDKHQVMRNHELVGQINVDQLEARVDRAVGEDEGKETQAHKETDVQDSEVEKEGDTKAFLLVNKVGTNRNTTNTSSENHTGVSAENYPREEQNMEPQRLSTAATLQNRTDTVKQCSAIQQMTQGKDLDTRAVNKPSCQSKPGEAKVALEKQNGLSLEGNATENYTTTEAETKMEEDILRQILELDEDCRALSNRNRQEQSKLKVVLLGVKRRPSETQEDKDGLSLRQLKTEAQREMLVLENEYFKGGVISSSEHNNPYNCVDGGAGDLLPLSKDDKVFSCKFCGRNLITHSELERHVKRHGM